MEKKAKINKSKKKTQSKPSKNKIFLIIGIFILVLYWIMFLTDYLRTMVYDKSPIFIVHTSKWNSGDPKYQYGIGYKIYNNYKSALDNGDRLKKEFYFLGRKIDTKSNRDYIKHDFKIINNYTGECKNSYEKIYENDFYNYFLVCEELKDFTFKFNKNEITFEEAMKKELITESSLINDSIMEVIKEPRIMLESISNDSKKKKELYSRGNIKIYSYGLESLYVYIDYVRYDLSQALKENILDLDYLFEFSEEVKTCGGEKSNHFYLDKTYMIECESKKKTNYVIGSYSMTEENACN